MRPQNEWNENDGRLAVIPEGTIFQSEDLVFYQSGRTLEEALDEADLLVTCPHAGAAIPAEIEGFMAPEFNRRLQFDFTDFITGPVVRRWAEIDPRVIYVENPHPRLVRDPNRANPKDLEASLRAAFGRLDAAGPYNPVDLSGVDAIRPVTFGFFPVLRQPESEGEWAKMIDAFKKVATQGVDVYVATRKMLLDTMIEKALARGQKGSLTTLSFHDTMNSTALKDGAIAKPRAPEAQLPPILAISNRGDEQGNPRAADPPSMDPERIRFLAGAFRTGFQAKNKDDVVLNTPYLGSREIIVGRDTMIPFYREAETMGLALDAVQFEFNRELLMGSHAAVHIQKPGTDWPRTDEDSVERAAQACKRSWDIYRESRFS